MNGFMNKLGYSKSYLLIKKIFIKITDHFNCRCHFFLIKIIKQVFCNNLKKSKDEADY